MKLIAERIEVRAELSALCATGVFPRVGKTYIAGEDEHGNIVISLDPEGYHLMTIPSLVGESDYVKWNFAEVSEDDVDLMEVAEEAKTTIMNIIWEEEVTSSELNTAKSALEFLIEHQQEIYGRSNNGANS